jgi:hypothetical protein
LYIEAYQEGTSFQKFLKMSIFKMSTTLLRLRLYSDTLIAGKFFFENPRLKLLSTLFSCLSGPHLKKWKKWPERKKLERIFPVIQRVLPKWLGSGPSG